MVEMRYRRMTNYTLVRTVLIGRGREYLRTMKDNEYV